LLIVHPVLSLIGWQRPARLHHLELREERESRACEVTAAQQDALKNWVAQTLPKTSITVGDRFVRPSTRKRSGPASSELLLGRRPKRKKRY